jgi:predicted permease
VLTARVALSPGANSSPSRIRVAWQEALERARRVPGVRAATMVDTVPMREGNNQIGYWTTPAEPPENQQPTALATCVTPEYLKVMGIELRRGRFFTDQDRMGNEPVAVIDDVMAQEAFRGQEPIGLHLWIGLGNDPLRVVGVVGHVRYWGPAGDDQASVRAQVYYPFEQLPDRYVRRWSELMSIAVRTGIPPLNMVEPLRREVRGSSSDQVLYEIRSMDQIAGASLARQRFLLLLFGVFAALALLLACIGIYGVLSYVTSRRVPEIGIRMALGAGAGDCMRLILRQSFGMIVAGAVIGMGAAFGAARLLERLVEGVRATDPLTFAAMTFVLAAAALFASFLPARRASRLDPVRALRQE